MKKHPIFVLLLVCILLAGCRATDRQTDSEQTPDPCLQLSYRADTESYTNFSDTDLAEELPCGLTYFQVTDVSLRDGDTSVPLEQALSDGRISLHKIHYLAQEDAAAGICYETTESKRGLTRFSYDYLSYKVIITNDIYETPDGKQHHIRNLIVTRTGCDPVSIYPELDQEDWGIDFEIAEVTPSGITLNYTQSGGQLIGQLRTGDYQLSRTDIVKAVFPLDDMVGAETYQIQHNAEGTISLDFENRFGILESGDYLLYLYLHDDYDPEDAPALIRNYHDIQCYGIEFSIP